MTTAVSGGSDGSRVPGVSGGSRGAGAAGAVGYRVVLRRGEFAALLGARVLSDWGDHVARVAVAALLLEQTGSVTLSAAAFAVSYLPSIVGQAVLGPYADRFERRGLLVVCDLLRAVLVTLLLAAVAADLPFAVLLAVLFLVELVGAPFYAAGSALLADVFPERRTFLTANALLRLVGQANQVGGLAVGGLVVATLGTDGALSLDAVSFLLSALLLLFFVRPRPPATREGHRAGAPRLWADVRAGASYLWGDVRLRSLMLLAWSMSVVFTAPEAVALAYAADQGASSTVGGLLLAAPPAGAVLGAWLVGRWPWRAQVQRMLPMAAAAGVPLLLVALEPAWPVALALFAVSGAFGAFMVPLLATFTVLAPDEMRGRLNGLAGAGFSAVTVLAFLGVGVVADLTSPAFAVTVAAAAGCAVLALVWPGWPRREIRRAAEEAYGR